jgi:Ribbon-helix-helix protein, copG family
MGTTESHVLSVKMPPEMRGKLASLAAAHDRSISAEVREAVRLHLRVNDVGVVGSSLPFGHRAPVDPAAGAREPVGPEAA